MTITYNIQELLCTDQELKEMEELITLQAPNIIVVGTGASVLNSKALMAFSETSGNIIFIDNIEPNAVDFKIQNCNCENSVIVAISKSGNTHETCLLTHYLLEHHFKTAPIIMVTEQEDSLLMEQSATYQGPIYFYRYESKVSGRFSLLKGPSLLPLYLAGADVKAIIQTAKLADSIAAAEELSQWLLENYQAGRNNLILSVYNNKFYGFAHWLRQIIAESLGKKGQGITPIISRGTIDEHSQLQLYLDGPDDKMYYLMPLLMSSAQTQVARKLTEALEIHSLGLTKVLKQQNRPCYQPADDILHENSLLKTGVDFICSWLMTIQLVAEQMNIEPFDQPAVEQIKRFIAK